MDTNWFTTTLATTPSKCVINKFELFSDQAGTQPWTDHTDITLLNDMSLRINVQAGHSFRIAYIKATTVGLKQAVVPIKYEICALETITLNEAVKSFSLSMANMYQRIGAADIQTWFQIANQGQLTQCTV